MRHFFFLLAIALVGCKHGKSPGWTCAPLIDNRSVVWGTISDDFSPTLVEYRLTEKELSEVSRTNFAQHAFQIAKLSHGAGYVGFGYSTPVMKDNGTDHHVCFWYADSEKKVKSIKNLLYTCNCDGLSIFPEQRTGIAMHLYQDEQREGAHPIFSILRVVEDNGTPLIRLSREADLSPTWGALHYGVRCKANTKLGWFGVVSPEGYPRIWKVNEESIQPIGSVTLVLPPNETKGIVDVDLSYDLRTIAVCKTVIQQSETNYCEIFCWNTESGATLPIDLRFQCTGIASIAFIDEQYVAIQTGGHYQIANVITGMTALVPRKIPGFKSSQLLHVKTNSFLLLKYEGRTLEYEVDTIDR